MDDEEIVWQTPETLYTATTDSTRNVGLMPASIQVIPHTTVDRALLKRALTMLTNSKIDGLLQSCHQQLLTILSQALDKHDKLV